MTDCQEQDGWRWRLELGDWFLPLPRRQIIGLRPMLPDPYSRSERTLTLYSSELKSASGQSFFGTVTPGVQMHAVCPLFLIREAKPKAARRRTPSCFPATAIRDGGGEVTTTTSPGKA